MGSDGAAADRVRRGLGLWLRRGRRRAGACPGTDHRTEPSPGSRPRPGVAGTRACAGTQPISSSPGTRPHTGAGSRASAGTGTHAGSCSCSKSSAHAGAQSGPDASAGARPQPGARGRFSRRRQHRRADRDGADAPVHRDGAADDPDDGREQGVERQPEHDARGGGG